MPTVPPHEVAALVEGESDAVVLRHLLQRDRVVARVVPMNGITNIDRWLAACELDPGVGAVAGLYDLAEERFVVRALHRRGVVINGAGLTHHGFFVCEGDLEDELIRAVGPDHAVAGLADIGLAGAFETFAQQPQWRDRPVTDQLHRFAGAGSGRKALIAAHLAGLLTRETTPAPLTALVGYVRTHAGSGGPPPR